jgi:hypothetical protein
MVAETKVEIRVEAEAAIRAAEVAVEGKPRYRSTYLVIPHTY